MIGSVNVLQIVFSWIIPLILGAILGFMVKIIKDNKAFKEGMIILLRSQIVGMVEKYMELGYLPDYARSLLSSLFDHYTILGGNHGVKPLVDQCFELPPIKKREEV